MRGCDWNLKTTTVVINCCVILLMHQIVYPKSINLNFLTSNFIHSAPCSSWLRLSTLQLFTDNIVMNKEYYSISYSPVSLNHFCSSLCCHTFQPPQEFMTLTSPCSACTVGTPSVSGKLLTVPHLVCCLYDCWKRCKNNVQQYLSQCRVSGAVHSYPYRNKINPFAAVFWIISKNLREQIYQFSMISASFLTKLASIQEFSPYMLFLIFGSFPLPRIQFEGNL